MKRFAITKNQLVLLNRRNAAVAEAQRDVQAANEKAEAAQQVLTQLISCFALDAGSDVGAEVGSVRFGEEAGECFVEMTPVEKPAKGGK